MKYATIKTDGTVEIREDNYPLADGAIELTNEQYDRLRNNESILQDGQIIDNPNYKTFGNQS
jgi:hypothetical protein